VSLLSSAEVLLMTNNNVDGIYDADPLKDPKARKFKRITHLEVLNLRLGVPDATSLFLLPREQAAHHHF
jgi:uridylate kinase